MHVKMVLAMSINGRITKGNDSNPAHWTSVEDHHHIMNTYKSSDVIVIGRSTYEAGPAFFASLPVRIAVLSHETSPEIAKKLPPNVRFLNGTPVNVLKHLADNKAHRVLIAGGGVVNSSFLKAGLVDELVITVEPKLFGTGKLAFADDDFTADMHLVDMRWLNPRGSILLTYRKAPIMMVPGQKPIQRLVAKPMVRAKPTLVAKPALAPASKSVSTTPPKK